ncbi:hypothetical protein POTOM_000961 [Populus tomentosa]|uniref:EF-hand domain-containing protein n=1 Tax=Populus tomentosa TaxID=118781 RepID=A0A8X8DH44_POPTO|nr:hypothetical protein POTOM_000961 [Populus tomentosa]
MGKDLSDDQVSSMKEAFTLFDTDGDGKIAPSELGILMRSLGGNPTQAQLKSIISQENLTAPFDFPRFLDLMAKHMKAEPFDRQLRDAFKVLDKDNTGFVAVADLRHILTSIGEKLELAEFDEWIREVDVGSDGRIRSMSFLVLRAFRFTALFSEMVWAWDWNWAEQVIESLLLVWQLGSTGRSLSLPRTTMLCIMVYWGFAGQNSNGSFCRFELCRLVEIEALEDFQSDAMVQQKVMAIVYFYIEIDSCEKL